MTKAECRAQTLAARKAIAPDDLSAWNSAIRRALENTPLFLDAPCLLTYVDAKDNEVQTRPIIATALTQGKGVLVPRCAAGHMLEWCEITSLDDLSPGAWGIPEPRPGLSPVPAPPDSLCLVPGIALHPDGHRIGYGGGYFDRFLAHYRGTSIGPAYALQVCADWTPDEHDIPVRRILTEDGFLK